MVRRLAALVGGDERFNVPKTRRAQVRSPRGVFEERCRPRLSRSGVNLSTVGIGARVKSSGVQCAALLDGNRVEDGARSERPRWRKALVNCVE
jgi:hypothetical protein